MSEATSLLHLFSADLFVRLKFLSVCLQKKSFELFPSLANFLYNVFLKDQGNELLRMIRILGCLICVFMEHTQRFPLVCYILVCVILLLLLQILVHMLDKGTKNTFVFNLQYFLIIVLCKFLKQITLYLVLRILIRMIVMN